MVKGHGGSLGAALVALLAEMADGTVGVRTSYTAKGWHAQISKLTSSGRGYQAAEKAGLSVKEKTLKAWLADQVTPTRANQDLIAKAYMIMRGRWPSEIEQRREIRISGIVKIGSDVRERGTKGSAPLAVDGSVGQWSELRRMWESGDVAAEAVEAEFILSVIEEDLGESSEAWEFPGPRYVVEA
ncbi:hypothetical protein ACF06O_30745 [Streptomyces albidoflavus]